MIHLMRPIMILSHIHHFNFPPSCALCFHRNETSSDSQSHAAQEYRTITSRNILSIRVKGISSCRCGGKSSSSLFLHLLAPIQKDTQPSSYIHHSLYYFYLALVFFLYLKPLSLYQTSNSAIYHPTHPIFSSLPSLPFPPSCSPPTLTNRPHLATTPLYPPKPASWSAAE